jgi:predicted transcriptional regulator
MENSIKRLPIAELEVIQIIWHNKDPITSSKVLHELQTKRTWGLPTLMTVLARLVEKGYLRCEKRGRNNYYYALIQEDEYKLAESRSLIERLFNNSFKNFASAFYSGEKIDKKELAELKKLIDTLEKEG